MSWIRRLNTIPPFGTQPLTGSYARCPSAAPRRGGSREEVTAETQGPAPPEQTRTPAWGPASLPHFRKRLPACPGCRPVKSNRTTAFPAAIRRHLRDWRAGRNGTQGLQTEGAALGLRQDGARNDPGTAGCEKQRGRKNTNPACPWDLSPITTQKPCTPILLPYGTSIGLTEL